MASSASEMSARKLVIGLVKFLPQKSLVSLIWKAYPYADTSLNHQMETERPEIAGVSDLILEFSNMAYYAVQQT